MNIDELIRAADPAARASLPSHDSPLARGALGRNVGPTRKSRRRYVVVFAAATLAAVTIVQIPSGIDTPESAAAVILDQVAAAAGHGGPLVLHKGEYLYTRTRSLHDDVVQAGGATFYPEYIYTDQSWQTAAGVGKFVTTVNARSPVMFAYGTRKAWIKAGRPSFLPKGGRSVAWPLALPKGVNPYTDILRAPHDAIPLANLSSLPTNPELLEQFIKDGKAGVDGINARVTDPTTPGGIFDTAMQLLTNPCVATSPALRAALFQVMAIQPGDKVIGPATTRSGRHGIAILSAPENPDGTDIFKVIVDRRNGQVLEFDQYFHPGGPVVQWSEFLAIAVVHHIGQVPRS